jgi:hypothetical protein
MIRILKCAFLMPLSRLVIASFVVFGSRTVGVRRQFVMFGGFPVRFVHVGLCFNETSIDRFRASPCKDQTLLTQFELV